jgi:hypothetical protein
MTDLRALLDTSNVTVLRLSPDDIDMARESIMADCKKELLSAAQIIRPGADLTSVEIEIVLAQLARTVSHLNDTMAALSELMQRSRMH